MAKGKKASVLKISSWYLICDILMRGIAFLTAPFFNRMMSAEEVGNYSNIVSWASLLLIIVTFEMSSSIANAKYDYEGKKLDRYISSILILGTIISAVFLGVFLIFRDFFCNLFNIEFKYLLVLFISFLVTPAMTTLLFKLRFQMRYKLVVLVTVLSTILTVATPVILVFLLDNKLDGRFFGYYIPYMALCLVVYIVLLIKGKFNFSGKHLKYALAISIPLAIHSISGSILSSFDRIMITDMCGAADNALYSNAYIFGTILLIVWHSFNSAWVPWCFEKFNLKDFTSVKKYSRIVLLPFALIIILAALLAPEGLFILGGDYYVTAKYVVPPVMAGCACTILYTFYVNVEQFYKKQKFIAIGTVAAAALNIGLNYAFIPMYGYVAAAYTTFASFFALLVFHFLIVKFYLKKTWIYDTKFVLIYLGAIVGVLALCVFSYTNNVLRYILAGVIFAAIVVVAILFRKQIMGIFKKDKGESHVKVNAIIQARCGSTRFPNKVFADIDGKPLIWHVVNRLKEAKLINEIIVATTVNPLDDAIEKWCNDNGVKCFRGDEANVLNRYYSASKAFPSDYVVRITADDPFKEPSVIDKVIRTLIDEGLDYVTNNYPPSFPEGLDCEAFTFKTLELMNEKATEDIEKEHVTQYVFRHLDEFKIKNVSSDEMLKQYRFTIDTKEDYEFVLAIYKNRKSSDGILLLDEILSILKEHPELLDINSSVKRSLMYK